MYQHCTMVYMEHTNNNSHPAPITCTDCHRTITWVPDANLWTATTGEITCPAGDHTAPFCRPNVWAMLASAWAETINTAMTPHRQGRDCFIADAATETRDRHRAVLLEGAADTIRRGVEREARRLRLPADLVDSLDSVLEVELNGPARADANLF